MLVNIPGVEPVEKLYSLQEAADYLHVTTRTVRNWIKDGRLRAFKIGRRLIIKESTLQAFVDALESQSEGGKEA